MSEERDEKREKAVEWRPEWREPKNRRGVPGISRARACAQEGRGPLPSDPEMRERAMWVLLDLAEDEVALPTARVGAAKTIVDITGKPHDVIMRLLDGDEAALEAWLRAELAALETKRKETA